MLTKVNGTDTLTVASYNVHRCVGRDRRHDPERVASVIEELAADVVALQEVDCGYHVHQGLDQLQFLAEATGYKSVWGPVLYGSRGQYGNGLLTRHDVLEVREIDLSVAPYQRRGAIDVDLSVRGARVRVIAAHLGLGLRERAIQVRRLLQLLGEPTDQPLILLGDFNEWRPPSAPLRRLHRHFGRTPGVRSFPAAFPLLALDRIWVRPRHALLAVDVHASRHARHASDHLPIRAIIDGRWQVHQTHARPAAKSSRATAKR
ncbi:MAG: endonuclease/exonuclease/phosphatase family protein [Candidatus Binatia bacterium]